MSDFAYDVDENALCFHGPLIYEAKVLEREMWTSKNTKTDEIGPHYFVHYKGWKNRWDDWVPSSRLLKLDGEGLARQAQLKEMHSRTGAKKETVTNNASPGGSGAGPSKASTSGTPVPGGKGNGVVAGKGKKRTRETALDNESDYLKRPEVKIPIPDLLKVKLVDDWEFVTKNQQLVTLPRTPTVKQIVEEYTAYATEARKSKDKPTRSDALLAEIMSGLVVYFNKALGNNLLYRFERGQYTTARHENWVDGEVEKPMSEIYGAEHLLRLFVNLPMFIAHTNMDSESISLLKEQIADFLKWMVKEQARLFQTPYEETTHSYQAASRTI